MRYDDRVPPEWHNQTPITGFPGAVPAVTTELLPPPVVDNSVGASTPLPPHSDAVKLEHARQAQENFNRRRAVGINQSLSPYRVTDQGLSAPLKALVDNTVKGQIVEDKVRNNPQVASVINNTFLPQPTKETAIRDITKKAIQQVEVAKQQILQPAPNPPSVEKSILPPLEQNLTIPENQAFNEKFGSARSNLDPSFDPETYGLRSEQPGSILPEVTVPERSVAELEPAETIEPVVELEPEPEPAETIELEPVSAKPVVELEPEPVSELTDTKKADEFLGRKMAYGLKPYVQSAYRNRILDIENPESNTAPNADPKNAVVVGIPSTKKATAPLQKAINTELARLKASTTTYDKDSTMPFWNWLADFSAGMRAAAKGGDQSIGAIAAGFDNVRTGAKERAATKLASRTAAIKNISELAGAAEDLASITGAGNFSGFGTAAGQFFKTAGLPRSGPITQAMVNNTNLNLDLVRKDYTYKTDKQNNVDIKSHERGTLENAPGWELDKDGLPKGKPITFVKGSKKYNDAVLNGTHTFTPPDEIETVATDSELRKILGNNYDAWKNKGAIIFLKKRAGRHTGLRIKNLPPGKWVNLYNGELNRAQLVDASIAGSVETAMENGFNVRMDIQSTAPPRSRASVLRTSNTAAQQSMALVDKLVAEDDRRRAAGEVPLFGAIGGIKRTYQNFTELASDIGRSLPIISWMGQSAAQNDYNYGMTEDVQDTFDKWAAQLPIFKTMLVYALAKARKVDNSRLNQHDVALARKDIDKLGVLTSSRQIREGLLAVKTQFQNVVDTNTEELNRIVGTKPLPELKAEGPDYEEVVRQLKEAKANNHPNLKTFIKRTDDMYGAGTANRALGN